MRKINTPSGDWIKGDPSTNTKGTVIKYWFLQMLQDELCNVVTSAGLPLDAADPEAEAPDNTLLYQALDLLISAKTVPTGAVLWVPGTVAPAGTVKINGALLSRDTYADLYAYAIASNNIIAEAEWQTAIASGGCGAFSDGDGVTTFRLPDYRGEGFRAWDDGRGIDSGRVIGTWQADEFKEHTHVVKDSTDTGSTQGVFYYADRGASNNQGSNQVSPTGGSETRMRNVAALACIKY